MAGKLAASAQDQFEAQEPEMARTRAAFSFFSIPPEPREQIYAYVVVTPRSSLSGRTYEIDISKGIWRPPAILQVCRAILHEAMPVHFGRNVFQAEEHAMSKRDMREWLRLIGRERASLIKEFVVYFDDFNFGWLQREVNKRRKGTPVALTKKSFLDYCRLEGCGVAHEAFRVLSDFMEGEVGEMGSMQELLDDGSFKQIEGIIC